MTAYLRRGELNRYVEVQKKSGTEDSFGGEVQDWTALKSVYAKIEVLQGRELVAAQAIVTEVSHRITVQYDIDLWADPKAAIAMRIVYRKPGVVDRIFDIRACMNIDEEDRAIELLAFEGMTNG